MSIAMIVYENAQYQAIHDDLSDKKRSRANIHASFAIGSCDVRRLPCELISPYLSKFCSYLSHQACYLGSSHRKQSPKSAWNLIMKII